MLVILVAAIHDSAPRPARMFTLVALEWTLIMAALTTTVHSVELTSHVVLMCKQPRGFHAFGFEWPSLPSPVRAPQAMVRSE
jgi:hypothetical protein